MERQAVTKVQKIPASNNHPHRQSARSTSAGHTLLALQRAVGNQAIRRLTTSPFIQAKLQISTPGDPSEQEADHVADSVMRMTVPSAQSREEEKEETIATKPVVPLAVREDDEEKKIAPVIQRRCTECEEEKLPVQEQSGGMVHRESATEQQTATPKVTTSVAANIHAMNGGGRPLPSTTRAFLEPRFGADFSQVRVHTDSRAAGTANSIQARAFTVGSNIAFGAGQYAPESGEGRRLLAHELTHVIQQNRSQVQSSQQVAAKVMRQPAGDKKLKPVAPPCPGSCHVHVEHYERAFGGGGAEPGSLRERKPMPLSQQELEALSDWIARSGPGPVSTVAPTVTASNELTGGQLKADVASEYAKHEAEFRAKPNNRVQIIRFEVPAENDPDWPKYRASEISADQKKKTFTSLGLRPEEKVFPRSVTSKDFSAYIKAQNADEKVFGIIVQLPTPPQLRSDAGKIAPGKDLDALSTGKDRSFKAPATAEGVVRVVLSILKPGQTVAVIGGGRAPDAGALGFVGGAVVELLRDQKITVKVFEEGDDLKEVKKYDLVVSAVGTPRVVKKEYLKPEHELVVDTGFIPETGGKVVGDVEESARSIPRHITAVPGGTGPIEMAVLMERAAKLLGIKARSWKVELRDGKLRAVFIE